MALAPPSLASKTGTRSGGTSALVGVARPEAAHRGREKGDAREVEAPIRSGYLA